jgi:hypothetical protein
MDSSLFSHPIAEEPRPGTLTAPQDVRYGGLFRQPVYTPGPSSGGAPGPQRRPGTAAHDPSGRR